MSGATGVWRRLRADARVLAAEPVVALVVAGLFALLALFILYPLARVFWVGFVS